MSPHAPASHARPFRSSLLVVALACVAALQPGPRVAHAQLYLPLMPGATWSYVTPNGLHETQTVTGTTTVFGQTYAVISYTNSLANAGLENYWSTNAQGDILLAGFFRHVEDVGLLYDPPILWLDAPLAVGNTWSATQNYFQLPGVIPQGSFTVSFQVYEAPVLALPAGSFPAFGIGQVPPAAAVEGLAARGLAVDGTAQVLAGQAAQWYAPGVGLVQYDSNDRFQLASYGLPTPVAATSWGRVKAGYRH